MILYQYSTGRKINQEAGYMKCSVDGGVAMVDCRPVGNGKCAVEGGVVPCPQEHPRSCSTAGGNACVSSISITDSMLTRIEDLNSDGYICGDEVVRWIDNQYSKVWGNAVFSTCENFDKNRAVGGLKDLHQDMQILANRTAYTLFYQCPDGVAEGMALRLSLLISRMEKGIIDYTIPAAVANGAGQLGFSWNAGTGEISDLRQDSDGARSGLKDGDKIISVDGFKYADTADFKFTLLSKHFPWLSDSFLPVPTTYESMKKLGVPANSLFFGPCGSMAKVEIERDGQRMVLEIKRGRG